MSKFDDLLGAGIIASIALFALTSCSFEKPVPEENIDVVPTITSRTGGGDTDIAAANPDLDVSLSTPTIPAGPRTDGDDRRVCSIATTQTGTLTDARVIFSDICASFPQPDCDPAEGGGYQCSSVQIGSDSPDWVEDKVPAPVTNIVITGEPDVPTTEEPENPTVPEQPGGETDVQLTIQTETQAAGDWQFIQDPLGYEGEGALLWLGRNNFFLSEAGDSVLSYDLTINTPGRYDVTVRSAILRDTPGRPDLHNDVWLRVNDGAWTKLSHQNRNGWQNTNPKSFDLTAGGNTVQLSGRSFGFAVDSITLTPPTTVSGDLYALHFDVCPDRDDIHAMPANRAVLDEGSYNTMAVIGTCGTSIRDRYTSVGESIFYSLYPDGLNAADDYSGAVAAASQRWEDTLNAGYRVLVAEGGQSDFTADVVRSLPSSVDKNDIIVVQHAIGYNEGFTQASNLAYLKANVDYRNIANGNSSGNSTANLASWQQGLQDTTFFVNMALTSKYEDQWVEAFRLLNPVCRPQSYTCRVDFSDSVELLYLVGDTTTTDINSFALKYLK